MLGTLHHFDLYKIDNSATASINKLGDALPPVSKKSDKVAMLSVFIGTPWCSVINNPL